MIQMMLRFKKLLAWFYIQMPVKASNPLYTACDFFTVDTLKCSNGFTEFEGTYH
jgi:hypothetical protein